MEQVAKSQVGSWSQFERTVTHRAQLQVSRITGLPRGRCTARKGNERRRRRGAAPVAQAAMAEPLGEWHGIYHLYGDECRDFHRHRASGSLHACGRHGMRAACSIRRRPKSNVEATADALVRPCAQAKETNRILPPVSSKLRSDAYGEKHSGISILRCLCCMCRSTCLLLLRPFIVPSCLRLAGYLSACVCARGEH